MTIKDYLLKDKYSAEIIWSEEDEAFLVRCPELGESFIAFGEDRSIALMEFETALRLHLGAMQDAGHPIPEPRIIKDASEKLQR